MTRLVHYKRWADRGLYDVVGQNLDRMEAHDAAILLRILDHAHVVDRIFQHHLLGMPHAFPAPRSDDIPDLPALATSVREVDDWYASYAESLQGDDPDQVVDFVFTNGTPARHDARRDRSARVPARHLPSGQCGHPAAEERDRAQ